MTLATVVQRLVKVRSQQFPVMPYQDICPLGHGNWPLRVLAQGQARRPKIRGLLLYTTGVGDDNRRMLLESEKFKIPQRIDNAKIRAPLRQPLRPFLASSWMDRKNQGGFALKLSSTCSIGKNVDSSSTFDGR